MFYLLGLGASKDHQTSACVKLQACQSSSKMMIHPLIPGSHTGTLGGYRVCTGHATWTLVGEITDILPFAQHEHSTCAYRGSTSMVGMIKYIPSPSVRETTCILNIAFLRDMTSMTYRFTFRLNANCRRPIVDFLSAGGRNKLSTKGAFGRSMHQENLQPHDSKCGGGETLRCNATREHELLHEFSIERSRGTTSASYSSNCASAVRRSGHCT